MLSAMKPDDSADTLPPPPGLHWALVLLLGVVTFGFFWDAWFIVQALWARKVDPSSRALFLYGVGFVLQIICGVEEYHVVEYPVQIAVAAGFAGLLVMLYASFSVKDTLAAYTTSVTGRPTYLSGLMTIFFSEVYLQYHMNKVRSLQRSAVLAGVR